uniref:CCHC-type domain-containing protein n=1 Tax=Fagus sylvatica TaxID=28930 RepID=A0A2N9ESX3_FAGSY
MDKSELPKTVTTILNGHNYLLWSQDMHSFLKGHHLWHYITGEIQAPVHSKDEDDTKFPDRLKDWDCKNHQIITWFRHSTFLMAMTSEFEPVHAALLQQVSLSTLEFAMSQLLSHETRLRTLQPHHPDAVLTTVAHPLSSSSSRNGPKYCKNCHKQGHLLSKCPTIQCRYCRKIGHIVYNCPTKPPKLGQSGILPRPVNHSIAAAAEDSPSDPSLLSVPVSELGPLVYTMVKQFMSSSDKVSSAVSDPRTNQVLGTGRRVGRMFELTSLHLPSTPIPPPSHVAHTAFVFPLSLWHLRLGTVIQRSCAGTSQQNGRAKRKHRHILDSVRVFFISASCPERFWGEAALTAFYTINRLPSSALQNVTSFERLYDPSAILPISPANSSVSPLAPPLVMDPILDQTSDLPLAAPPANSPASPQEPAPPMDPVTDQTPLLPLRRSNRVRAPPAHLHDYSCFLVVLSLHEPHTYREACTNPLWQQAMTEELQALEKTHTWDLVDLPHGKSTIGCKWVYKIKTKSDGSIERYKACLITKGYTQEYGIGYEETFALLLVLPLFAIFLLLLSHDTALFLCRSDKGMILLLLYVDDMIITGDDHSGISDFKLFLHQQFEMKDLGHLSYFLGLEVSSDSTGYYLSQAKYASDLLSRAGLTDTKVVSTPLEMNARLTPLDGTPLNDATLYRQLVGSLVYLTLTCPDIAHAVHLVSQFLSAPHSTHYAAVIHILRYIKGTMFHGLHFSAHSTLDLCAYSDADWVRDPTDRCSTTGFCFFLGDSLISWRSKKQHIVSRSSTEAEYHALADTTSKLLALRWLLEDMGLTHSSPTVIHCDNHSAI